jgi:hypothetical protein
MLFKSAYADFQVLVRSEAITYHPATGVEINRIPPLTANFGQHRGEYETPDWITGGTHEGVVIMGHFFDSEAAQEQGGWTDEERESVEQAILKLSREQPYLVAPVVIEIPAATKPWPSYDEQTAKEIVAVAAGTGLVDEALAYERENKSRSTLLIELEQIALAKHQREQEQEMREQEREAAEITL